jgi:eukaryotic-like serine/threonine-protein kinase
MATGKLPFPGNSTAEVFVSLLSREPEPPRKLNPGVSNEGKRIILKLLSKGRTQRYQTATEVRADLEQLSARSGTSRTAATSPGMGASSRRAFPVVPVAAGIIVIALAIGGYLWWHGHASPGKGASTSTAAPIIEKDSIILSDFTNQTGDPVFDTALNQALAIQLEQSPLLSIVSQITCARASNISASLPTRRSLRRSPTKLESARASRRSSAVRSPVSAMTTS